jgi:hypothetical protein
MNKEKVLALISEAMDKGAWVSVHVGQFNQGMAWPWDKHTKEEAESYINRFEEALGGGEIENNSNEENRLDDFEVEKGKIRAIFSYFPYMEEDVKFHEEEGEHSA